MPFFLRFLLPCLRAAERQRKRIEREHIERLQRQRDTWKESDWFVPLDAADRERPQ